MAGGGATVFDPRHLVAGFLTLSMFVMLGNMIKNDHFTASSFQVAIPESSPEEVRVRVLKVEDHITSKVTTKTSTGTTLTEMNRNARPCLLKPTPTVAEHSKGFVTFSLTRGPEYHALQVADAVVITRYLGATLVLPDIRDNDLGRRRTFQDMYDVGRFVGSLDGVVKTVFEIPAELTQKRPAVIRVPSRVTEEFITQSILPIFQTDHYIRVAITFPSVSMRLRNEKNKDLHAALCTAMFRSLQLNAEVSEIARTVVDRLRRAQSRLVAVDLRLDALQLKGCKSAGRKSCFNAGEVAEFLKKIGFGGEDTIIYLTETRWHSDLNPLKEIFPKTYTKDDIMPAEKKEGYLQAGAAELVRLIDIKICALSDVFVPTVPSMFYGHVAGERIADGKAQILVPALIPSSSALASDYLSSYVSKRNHLAHSCSC